MRRRRLCSAVAVRPRGVGLVSFAQIDVFVMRKPEWPSDWKRQSWRFFSVCAHRGCSGGSCRTHLRGRSWSEQKGVMRRMQMQSTKCQRPCCRACAVRNGIAGRAYCAALLSLDQKNDCGIMRMSPGWTGTFADRSASCKRSCSRTVVVTGRPLTIPRQFRPIASRVLRQPADRDHGIENRHVGTIGQRLRLCSLAHDPYLLARKADKTADNYCHDGILHVFPKPLFDVTRQLGWCFASTRNIFHQRD